MKKIYSFLFCFLSIQILSAQIPNSDFELWDNQPTPLYWHTNSRPLTAPAYDPYIVRQDTERYTSNFAANLYGNGAFKAYAITTFPVSVHPLQLSLYYKLSFAPCVNDLNYFEQDTVSVFVELLNNGTTVDTGYWYSKTTNFNYTQLLIPVSQNAPTFDSCRITLRGGKIYGGCGFAAAATEFKVDHLELIDSVIQNPCGANFTFTKHIDTVNLYNSSYADSITGYLWSFGDGDTSSLQNPTHVYGYDSTYIVCLHLIGLDSLGNNCASDFCDTILITHNCVDSSLICPPGSLCCDAPLFQPVCGCDSVTYTNACIATSFGGVTSAYEGTCVTTGIKNISETEVGIFVSPVPASDLLKISYTNNYSGNTEIRLLNTLGQTLNTASIGFEVSGLHKTQIELNDLFAGIYLVEVKTVNEKKLKRFVKE